MTTAVVSTKPNQGTTELSPETVREMNRELRTLISERIENRMQSRGLRDNAERNQLVNTIYSRYLEVKDNPNTNLFEAREISSMLESAKKLATLADLIDGDNGKTELAALLGNTDMGMLLRVNEKSKDISFWLTPESLLLEQKLYGTYKKFWNDSFTVQLQKPTNHHEPEAIAQMAGVDPSQVQVLSPEDLSINNRFFKATGNFRNRSRSQITTVVCHESAGPSLSSAVSTLQRRGLSYHFIIDKDGTVYQLQPIDARAAHAKGGNANGIGVCLVGGGSREEFGAATAAQQASLAALTNALKKEVPTLQNVMLHREVNCSCTDCNAAGADMHLLSRRTGLRYNPDAL